VVRTSAGFPLVVGPTTATAIIHPYPSQHHLITQPPSVDTSIYSSSSFSWCKSVDPAAVCLVLFLFAVWAFHRGLCGKALNCSVLIRMGRKRPPLTHIILHILIVSHSTFFFLFFIA